MLQGAAALIAYRNAIGSLGEDPCFHVKFLIVASCFLETSPFAKKIVSAIRDDLVSTYPRVPVVQSELAKLHLNVYYESTVKKSFIHLFSRVFAGLNVLIQCYVHHYTLVFEIDFLLEQHSTLNS